MTQPKPLWELVDRWFSPGYREIHADTCADELATALREWDAAIDEGIEHLPPSPYGPLHTQGMVDEARIVQENLLGVPEKEKRP